MAFRHVLTPSAFDAMSSLSTSPINQWTSLEVGSVFRVLDIVKLPLKDRSAIYAILQAKNGEILKVWITAIIYNELQKYEQCQGAVFIKPLGKRMSSSTGRMYFDFSVVHSLYH